MESLGGMNEAVEAARAMAAQRPDVFLPDQFSNPANPEVHRRTTGPEIWQRRSTATSTCSSPASGPAGRSPAWASVLKARNPDAARHRRRAGDVGGAVGRPPGPHQIQGIGAGFVPAGARTATSIDEIVAVADEDAIARRPRWRAREGVLAGMSCGAALWAALEVGRAARAARASGSSRSCPTAASATSRAPFFAP